MVISYSPFLTRTHTDINHVKNSPRPHCEIFFDGIYAVLLQNQFYCNFCCLSQHPFCRNLCTFCVETNHAQNFVRGEKMKNIMYGQDEQKKEWQARCPELKDT